MINNKLNFIIGIWRSGTTLLREILAMNDSVKVFEEHSAILQTLQFRNQFNLRKNQILQTIESNKDFVDFSQPKFNFSLNENRLPTNYNSLIKAIYQSTTENTNATFIDKNPIYSFYLPELLEEFPAAKFVWMIREPKDNCASRKKQNIQSYKNSSYLATWWNVTNEIIAASAKLHPDRFLLIHYEDLVQSSELIVNNICNFLDIEFNQEMLEFEKNKHNRDLKFHESLLRSGRIADKDYNSKISSLTENLQQPINASKIGNWKNELKPLQAKSIDSICESNYQKLLKNELDISSSNSIHKILVHLSLKNLKINISNKRK